ncbi:MAG: hypothetical protein WAM44_03045 [Chthoniobacterales bacterium]
MHRAAARTENPGIIKRVKTVRRIGRPARGLAHDDEAQRGAISVELGVWVGSGVLAILGLVQAVHSTQPFLWLAVWPAPVGLVCTIFIFLRQGFHFRNGVLVLGRRTANK